MSSITAPETLCKEESEKRRFEMHFSNLLDTSSGEILTGVPSVTSTRIGGGTSDLLITSATIVSGVSTPDSAVRFWIEDGTNGRRYDVQCNAGTSGGQLLEGHGILSVTNK